MYPIFQIANAITDQTATEPATMSLWELACVDGWIMIVLLLLPLVAIYVFVAKYIELRRVNRPGDSLIAYIKDYLQMGREDSAVALCKGKNIPEVHMIEKELKRLGRPVSEVLPTVENVGSYEVGRLERGLPLLAMIAAGAPMIGSLGTVTGMVQAFFDLANAPGGTDVSLPSSGIYQALVTTVGGLTVGIVTLFLYNYLVGQINRIINRLETNTLDSVDVTNEL